MIRKPLWLAMVTALLLAACGGGSDAPDVSEAVKITSVKVMGDSLADSGTFGLKFTVQGDAPVGQGSTPIWPERVAQGLGVTDMCPHFQINPTSGGLSLRQECSSFAVGGGRINLLGTASDPRRIPLQLQTAALLRGTYSEQDLVLIVGGGNDAADLAGAFLAAAVSPQGLANYTALLASLLGENTVVSLLQQPNGAVLGAGAYMQALADVFHDTIRANVTAKGATKVAVLNMPDITLTPRFQTVLLGVAQANGGGEMGMSAAMELKGAIQQWVGAFNARLNARFDNDPNVALVDFSGVFTQQVNSPESFGLTNAKDAACPVTGLGNDGLPEYDFPSCTATALSAMMPPEGATGGSDWWKTYIFSDGFHPTPYGHELLAREVNAVLAARGWL
jgi:outer membrane lipase/esterase